MPLTKSGEKVLKRMQATYGKKKGEEVFNKSIADKKKGSNKWLR
ncbi:hypothetical protein LCGC14_1899670 [marine sediment metagenome]|uniref:Uncharacterized protein n=1 Tax=marine sediment metagenome TaxID=412755 RepID=A0A0F9FWZ3_9ZZZZ